MRSLRSTTSLNTSASRPSAPGQSGGRRTEASPRLSALSAPMMILISFAGTTARADVCMVMLRWRPGRKLGGESRGRSDRLARKIAGICSSRLHRALAHAAALSARGSTMDPSLPQRHDRRAFLLARRRDAMAVPPRQVVLLPPKQTIVSNQGETITYWRPFRANVLCKNYNSDAESRLHGRRAKIPAGVDPRSGKSRAALRFLEQFR